MLRRLVNLALHVQVAGEDFRVSHNLELAVLSSVILDVLIEGGPKLQMM